MKSIYLTKKSKLEKSDEVMTMSKRFQTMKTSGNWQI